MPANFSGCSGSAIERAPESGKMLGTPASNWLLMTALFIGVPRAPTMAKMLSRWISLLAAWTARGTWY